MRYVICVAEQQLKLVLAQGQGDRCLCLPSAEMQVMKVIRNRPVERRQVGIDQEMVMTGIGLCDARRRDAHVFETEVKGDVLVNHRTVM